MEREHVNRFFNNLKSAFLAGALVLAPLGITAWVFFGLVGVADKVIDFLPASLRPETYLGFGIPGLGVLITLVGVALVGLAMRMYTGRRVVEFYEGLLARVPVLNAVYQGLKQLIETLFGQQGTHFREVVLIEYPRRGIHCMAFLTNQDAFVQVGSADVAAEDALISVFLPTTPNPTSGFYLLVPRKDVRRIDIGVEEAFKLIMSAGIVTPDTDRLANDWVGYTNPGFLPPTE